MAYSSIRVEVSNAAGQHGLERAGHSQISCDNAQVNDGPCVTYVGPGGAGNFVKMVHNGIEYGDMQLISEAYDVLRTVGGLTNEEMVEAFSEWNAVRSFPPLTFNFSLTCISS